MSLFSRRGKVPKKIGDAIIQAIDNCPNVISLSDLCSEPDDSPVTAVSTGAQPPATQTQPATMKAHRKSTNINHILNDIVKYILGHFPLKKYVVGVVVDSSTDASAAISVKKLGIKSMFDVNVSSEYLVRNQDVKKSSEPFEPYWIKEDFPDIVTAVEHDSKCFERIESISKHSSIGASIDFSILDLGGSYQKEQKLKIYIYYEQ